ncbi:MAG: bifunctional diguanylate cyclase/phosphodiesterase [Cycloclasticus sp.]
MDIKVTNDKSTLLNRIDDILNLTLPAYLKLKLVLRTTRKELGADRCWLLFPCNPNAKQYLVPLEDTSIKHPGTNRLKISSSANPAFQQIINQALTSQSTISVELSSKSSPELKQIYKQFHVKSQMACQIPIENKDGWVIGIHHCEHYHHYAEEDKRLLTTVANKIRLSLNQLFDIHSVLHTAELATDILENSQLAQSIYNADLKIVYANAAYCRINHRQLKDIIGVHGKQFVSENYKNHFDSFIDEIRTHGYASIKGEKLTGEGKVIHTENAGCTILYNRQKHYLITSQDVTNEVEAVYALENSLDIQRAILEATDDGVLVEDLNRNIIAINQKFYEYFDINPPNKEVISTLELLKTGLQSLLNPEEIGSTVSQMTPSTTEVTQETILLKNGTILDMNAFPLIHEDDIKGRVWYFKDVTKQTRSTQALENALDVQRAINEATDDGMLVEDLNGQVINVNQVFLDTFLIPQHVIEQRNQTSLNLLKLGLLVMTNAEEIAETVKEIHTKPDKKTNLLIHLNDGRVLDTTSFPLIREGLIQGRVWYYKDITDKYQLTHKLSFEATHDPLTKLVNRRGFDEILQNAIANIQSNNSVHALLYLDLDQFKIINDSSGHSAGDLALIEISKILSGILRKADALARVGGDEFCILLRDCSPEVAKKIAEKIRQAIDKFIFIWSDKEYNLGVSIGVVSLDETVKSYESALNLADTSCYLAKEAGRNRIHEHTTADQAVIQRLQEGNIVSKIHTALKQEHFVCYAQKICVTTPTEGNECQMPHYEILIRMQDNKGQIHAPHTFLPAAERYKLAYKIDHWVIKKSLSQMASIQNKFGWISINLSGQTIAHEETYDVIVSAIKRSGMPADKLCFEITETAAITNPRIGMAFLNKLRELGCKVALDDFGTGLSSYAYLKKLPVDILKIDGQFIKSMLDDKLDLAMVQSINEIAHLMGKKTIGEFVENPEIFAKLNEIGIDYGQGYHLHKPCSVQSLIETYQASEAS